MPVRLHHLSASSFEGLHSFDKPLMPLTVIAGPNHCGKTSLIESIRYVLTGEVVRVSAKGDYPLLVTEGATKSLVALSLTVGAADEVETIKATLPTGKHILSIDPAGPAALALDPPRFMRMSADARRAMVYGLSEDRGDVLDLARRRLKDAGGTDDMLSLILPSLRAGFPEAFKQASEQASSARSAWRTTTGEVYGSQKAEGWKPAAPLSAPTGDELHEARTEHAAAKQAVIDAAAAVGALTPTIDAATRQMLVEDAEQAKEITAEIEQAEINLQAAKAEHIALVDQASQTVGLFFDCPCCGKALRYAQGVASEATSTPSHQGHVDADAAVRGSAMKIAGIERTLMGLRNRLAAAENAQARLAAADATPSQESDSAARTALDDAKAREADAETALKATEARLEKASQQAGMVKKAAEYHEQAKAWAAVAAVLAPDGLPQELMGMVVRPINEALREAPKGWPIIQLRNDMTLTINGRPYGLCSESEQWRADVLIATWFAERSGSGLVLIDRMDVLDPGSRLPLLYWLADRAEDGTHQFIVSATFYMPPALDFAKVYWLADLNGIAA